MVLPYSNSHFCYYNPSVVLLVIVLPKSFVWLPSSSHGLSYIFHAHPMVLHTISMVLPWSLMKKSQRLSNIFSQLAL